MEQAVAQYEAFLAHPAEGTTPSAITTLRVRLGTAYFMLREYPQSLQALTPLIAADRRNPPEASEQQDARPLLAQAWLICGLDHLEMNDANEAIAPLRRALALDPTNANARLALGDAFARTKQMEKAEEEYDKQLQLTPSLAAAWYKLGMVHIQLAADWRKRLSAQSGNILAQELTAEYLLEGEANWDAARLLLGLAKAAPNQPGVHADLGRALFALGYTKSAAEEFRRELAFDPDDPTAMLGLAEAELLQQQWAAADAEVDGLAKSQPQHLMRLVESAPAGPLRQAWNDGVVKEPPSLADTPEGDFWKTWLTTSTVTPEKVVSIAGPSEACAAQGTPADSMPGMWLSEACYRRLLHQLEDRRQLSSRVREKLVETQFRLGEYAAALRQAKILFQTHPQDPWASYWLSRAHSELAGDCFVKVALLDPTSPRVHQMLAERYLGWGQFTQAVAEYQTAIRLAPTLPDLYLGLGDTYAHMLDWSHAVAEYQQTLELAPGSVAARAELGHAMVKLGNWKQAIAELSQIPADAPQAVAAKLDLADAENQVGETRQAIADLQPFLSQDKDGEIHFRLAAFYRKIGDSADAKEAMQAFQTLRAAELAVSHGEIQALENEKPGDQQSTPPSSN